jgi:hypothetical protein
MKEDGLESNGRWSDWNTSDFCLWGCMKSRVYRGGKSEGRHLSAEVITEGAVGNGNELQRRTSMAKGLAACIQCEGGDFEHVVSYITLEYDIFVNGDDNTGEVKRTLYSVLH